MAKLNKLRTSNLPDAVLDRRQAVPALIERPSDFLIVTGLGLAGLGIGLVASSNGGGPITSTTAAITTSSNTP